MKVKKSLYVFFFALLIASIGFGAGYSQSLEQTSIVASSEISLIDSVDRYGSEIITGIENEYIDLGVKAGIGITDIKISGDTALVCLVMHRYDPISKDSVKSFHITQWQLKDGVWVI